ncbi:hypothetical protein PENTCL1PPCAC_5360, partial [Pristionchus entomophagus]
DHFAYVVVPQWERAICRKALALDVRNPSSSLISSLLRLLNIIWQSPNSYFPVARRVTIGVLADMGCIYSKDTVTDIDRSQVLPCFPDSGIKAEHLPSIL